MVRVRRYCGVPFGVARCGSGVAGSGLGVAGAIDVVLHHRVCWEGREETERSVNLSLQMRFHFTCPFLQLFLVAPLNLRFEFVEKPFVEDVNA